MNGEVNVQACPLCGMLYAIGDKFPEIICEHVSFTLPGPGEGGRIQMSLSAKGNQLWRQRQKAAREGTAPAPPAPKYHCAPPEPPKPAPPVEVTLPKELVFKPASAPWPGDGAMMSWTQIGEEVVKNWVHRVGKNGDLRPFMNLSGKYHHHNLTMVAVATFQAQLLDSILTRLNGIVSSGDLKKIGNRLKALEAKVGKVSQAAEAVTAHARQRQWLENRAFLRELSCEWVRDYEEREGEALPIEAARKILAAEDAEILGELDSLTPAAILARFNSYAQQVLNPPAPLRGRPKKSRDLEKNV